MLWTPATIESFSDGSKDPGHDTSVTPYLFTSANRPPITDLMTSSGTSSQPSPPIISTWSINFTGEVRVARRSCAATTQVVTEAATATPASSAAARRVPLVRVVAAAPEARTLRW